MSSIKFEKLAPISKFLFVPFWAWLHKSMGWNCICSIILLSGDCLVLTHFSRVWLFATPWTVACQAPLFLGFSRPEYWSGLPCPPPGDLLDPGIETASLRSPALAGGFFTTSATWEAYYGEYLFIHCLQGARHCSRHCRASREQNNSTIHHLMEAIPL